MSDLRQWRMEDTDSDDDPTDLSAYERVYERSALVRELFADGHTQEAAVLWSLLAEDTHLRLSARQRADTPMTREEQADDGVSGG